MPSGGLKMLYRMSERRYVLMEAPTADSVGAIVNASKIEVVAEDF